MNFAIIAAGEGSRLVSEGCKWPKPLIRINGITLVERLIRVFIKNGALKVTVVINSNSKEVFDTLKNLQRSLPIEIIVKNTLSSMHSLYELRNYITGDKFCVTTVDTVFREEVFKKYIDAFYISSVDGLMGVTDYIDDERPLFVETNDKLDIIGFHDFADNCRYVSGGIYGLDSSVFDLLESMINAGELRMRTFQRRLIDENFRLKAYPFGKIIDVDHISDILKAEKLLS